VTNIEEASSFMSNGSFTEGISLTQYLNSVLNEG